MVKQKGLFIDDERDPSYIGPFSLRWDWFIARSSSEAIEYVKVNGMPTCMSLDHDLGGSDTSIAFLRWLIEEGYEPPLMWLVHSENVCGRQDIVSIIKSWEKVHGAKAEDRV
jgi:hypothetical protein